MAVNFTFFAPRNVGGGSGHGWIFQSGDPNDVSDGANGDFYINTDTGDLFHKESDVWVFVASLNFNTIDGTTWYSGAGAPDNTLGTVEDFYINTLNGDVYEKTGVATWTFRLNIIGPAGATGATGSPGSPGNTGPQGSQGVQGSPGSTGSQGSPGSTGAQGTQGIQGIQGIQGNPGTTGSQGNPGSTGPAGAQGIQGNPGVTGSQGNPGTTGPAGAPGDGSELVIGSTLITSGATGRILFEGTGSKLSEDPSLRWDAVTSTLRTDGLDVGNRITSYAGETPEDNEILFGKTSENAFLRAVLVAGDRIEIDSSGLTGDGGEVVISSTGSIWYEDTGAPDNTLGLDGDFYLDSSNGDVYTKAAGDWGAPILNLVGPPGSTGAPGAAGSTGPQGAQGNVGSTGPQGAAGATGSQGTQGIQGNPGVTGSQGNPGVTGAQGSAGATGSQGSPGVTGPLGGLQVDDLQLIENKSILLDAVLSADGKWSGIAEAGTLGETVAFGEMVYLKAADSQWYLTDADAEATAGPVKVGCCVVAGVDNGATTILLFGKVRADSKFPALTVAAPVYLSTTPGAVQTAQPSGTDDVIRIVGYGNTGDELDFRPSNDYMTHT